MHDIEQTYVAYVASKRQTDVPRYIASCSNVVCSSYAFDYRIQYGKIASHLA